MQSMIAYQISHVYHCSWGYPFPGVDSSVEYESIFAGASLAELEIELAIYNKKE